MASATIDRKNAAFWNELCGSSLAIPFKDATFDYAYSIGCLHHAGDQSRGISEVHRVLAMCASRARISTIWYTKTKHWFHGSPC